MDARRSPEERKQEIEALRRDALALIKELKDAALLLISSDDFKHYDGILKSQARSIRSRLDTIEHDGRTVTNMRCDQALQDKSIFLDKNAIVQACRKKFEFVIDADINLFLRKKLNESIVKRRDIAIEHITALHQITDTDEKNLERRVAMDNLCREVSSRADLQQLDDYNNILENAVNTAKKDLKANLQSLKEAGERIIRDLLDQKIINATESSNCLINLQKFIESDTKNKSIKQTRDFVNLALSGIQVISIQVEQAKDLAKRLKECLTPEEYKNLESKMPKETYYFDPNTILEDLKDLEDLVRSLETTLEEHQAARRAVTKPIAEAAAKAARDKAEARTNREIEEKSTDLITKASQLLEEYNTLLSNEGNVVKITRMRETLDNFKKDNFEKNDWFLNEINAMITELTHSIKTIQEVRNRTEALTRTHEEEKQSATQAINEQIEPKKIEAIRKIDEVAAQMSENKEQYTEAMMATLNNITHQIIKQESNLSSLDDFINSITHIQKEMATAEEIAKSEREWQEQMLNLARQDRERAESPEDVAISRYSKHKGKETDKLTSSLFFRQRQPESKKDALVESKIDGNVFKGRAPVVGNKDVFSGTFKDKMINTDGGNTKHITPRDPLDNDGLGKTTPKQPTASVDSEEKIPIPRKNSR